MKVSKRRIFKDALKLSEDDCDVFCGWWAAQALNHQPKPCGAASSLALERCCGGRPLDGQLPAKLACVFMEPDGF